MSDSSNQPTELLQLLPYGAELTANDKHNEAISDVQAVTEFRKAFALYSEISEEEKRLAKLSAMHPLSLSEYQIKEQTELELRCKIDEALAEIKTLSQTSGINVENTDSEPDAQSITKHESKQRWQERQIVQKLMAMGYEPTSLPRYVAGKSSVKSEVKAQLDWTKDVFKKAWQRCLADGLLVWRQ